VVKINVDATVRKNLKKGTVAAVARDADGYFVGASAVIFLGRNEP
jgi:isoaspartyl peptidase/L-asparaginase-like protein (Ntn-hydrolase superfamily)